jgi:segregation and condensation protein B
MVKIHLLGQLEALLFASGDPLSNDKIASVMGLSPEEVQNIITQLSIEYANEARGLNIRQVAGGYQLTTKPELIDTVHKLIAQQEVKLSNAAMETLAIVAFKQPVTRSEMEAIRGVKVDGVVNTLLDANLIAEAGRKDALGHPILYITTDLFLTTFGLNTLHDLPEIPEEILEAKAEEIQEGALFSADGEVLTLKDNAAQAVELENTMTKAEVIQEKTEIKPGS